MPISLETAGILSVWIETLLYGIYASLFFEAVFIILKRKERFTTRPSRIFFGAIVIMFISTTLHIAINLYRVLQAYVWLADVIGPAAYWGNMSRWDAIARTTISTFTVLISDCLVIYRCYIVWDNNLPIVILPIAMVTAAIVVSGFFVHQFFQLDLNTSRSSSLPRLIVPLYTLGFLQNTMTTGLIVYRIWRQDRISQSIISSSLRLTVIARIIVESASIYLLNILVLIILYALNSYGQFVAQEAIVPVCGIVFTLIAVRLSLHTSTSVATTQHSSTQMIFATMPGTATATAIDQSTGADSSVRQTMRIDGNAVASDD